MSDVTNDAVTADSKVLAALVAVNETAAFNRWAGFRVLAATRGEVVLELPWRDDLGQYNGFLHASLIGGLIDTACGFAASTVCGPVLASQFAVRCMAPARGTRFTVQGRVVKAGRRQVFAAADLYCDGADSPERILCATGDAILVPLG